MNNKVTDLETSKQLQPHMPGVETEFCYVNGELHIIAYDGLPMSLKSGHRIASKAQSIPAYDLIDIWERLPNQINTHDKTSKYRYYKRLLHDSIHYSNYNHVVLRGKENIHAQEYIFEEQTLLQAAAQLLLWTVSEGYVGGDK